VAVATAAAPSEADPCMGLIRGVRAGRRSPARRTPLSAVTLPPREGSAIDCGQRPLHELLEWMQPAMIIQQSATFLEFEFMLIRASAPLNLC